MALPELKTFLKSVEDGRDDKFIDAILGILASNDCTTIGHFRSFVEQVPKGKITPEDLEYSDKCPGMHGIALRSLCIAL